MSPMSWSNIKSTSMKLGPLHRCNCDSFHSIISRTPNTTISTSPTRREKKKLTELKIHYSLIPAQFESIPHASQRKRFETRWKLQFKFVSNRWTTRLNVSPRVEHWNVANEIIILNQVQDFETRSTFRKTSSNEDSFQIDGRLGWTFHLALNIELR